MAAGGRRPLRVEAAVALLALGAGSMDALSFVTLGQVFTSAMSGNTVLLGLAIGQGRIPAALRSVAALAGFVAGAAVGCLPLGGTPYGVWSRGVTIGFAIEAAFLAAFCALLAATGVVPSGVLPGVLILLASAGMGAQSALARHLDVPGITTTFFTGTLLDIVTTLMGRAAQPAAGRVPYRTERQIAVFAVYTTGAAIGGFLAVRSVWGAAVLPLAAVLAVLASRVVGGAGRVRPTRL